MPSDARRAASMRAAPVEQPLFEALGAPAPRGTAHLYWLGQAGFALRSHNRLLLIDPYLSNALAEKYKDALFKHRRMIPPPIRPDELRGVHLLLATHGHSDHLDPGVVGAIMALNPDCVLVCPRAAREAALARGADRDRLAHPPPFQKTMFGPVGVEPLPAAHEEVTPDADGNPSHCGFILELDGLRLYHSGDCVPFEGLATLLAERRVDAALLPVNGRDRERRENGIPGNFTVEEAADLCRAAGIPNLIPHHFGMFDFNTVPPEDIVRRLAASAGAVRWLLPEVGARIVLS